MFLSSFGMSDSERPPPAKHPRLESSGKSKDKTPSAPATDELRELIRETLLDVLKERKTDQEKSASGGTASSSGSGKQPVRRICRQLAVDVCSTGRAKACI